MRTPYKMKGYTYPGTSPAKQPTEPTKNSTATELEGKYGGSWTRGWKDKKGKIHANVMSNQDGLNAAEASIDKTHAGRVQGTKGTVYTEADIKGKVSNEDMDLAKDKVKG
jgi:hypothetical protein